MICKSREKARHDFSLFDTLSLDSSSSPLTHLLSFFYLRAILFLNKRKFDVEPSAVWLAQLPEMSIKMEYELFLDAHTEEEYSDRSTLMSRIQEIRNELKMLGRQLRGSTEDGGIHLIRNKNLTRVKEGLVMYARVMSHSLSCETVGRCSVNDDCGGMKHLIKEHAECAVVDCRTCKTLRAIRELKSKMNL
jgi:hypothetical protein